jgi:hypothetical protein
VDFKVPVPQPDPKAQAWMLAEQNAPREHDNLIKKPLALVRTAPHNEFIAAARTGAPNLQPEADNTSATDILTPGNRSSLGGSPSGAGNAAVVEVVTPGGGSSTGAGTTTNGTSNGSDPSPTPAEASPASPNVAVDPNTTAAPAAAAPAASGSAASGDPANPASTTGDTSANAQNADGTQNQANQKESSSKKKKGIRKVVPW